MAFGSFLFLILSNLIDDHDHNETKTQKKKEIKKFDEKLAALANRGNLYLLYRENIRCF